MFCKKCGEKIKDYNGVCPACGYDNGFLKDNSGSGFPPKANLPFDRLSPAADISIEPRLKTMEKKIKRTRLISLFLTGAFLVLLFFCVILSVTTAASDRELKREYSNVTVSVREAQEELESVQADIAAIQNQSENLTYAMAQLIQPGVGDEDVQDSAESGQSFLENSVPALSIVWQSPAENIFSQDGKDSLCIVASGDDLTFNWQLKEKYGNWEAIGDGHPAFAVRSGENYSVLEIQEFLLNHNDGTCYRCVVTSASGDVYSPEEMTSEEMTFVEYQAETTKGSLDDFEDDDADEEQNRNPGTHSPYSANYARGNY